MPGRRVRTRYSHWAKLSRSQTKYEMGRRNFHGRVETLADAVEANYLIFVTCVRCEERKQMHPYKLIADHKRLTKARLGVSLPGFFCKACRHRVEVTITCTYRRPGEM